MSPTDTSEKVEPVKVYSTVTGQTMGLGLILLAGHCGGPEICVRVGAGVIVFLECLELYGIAQDPSIPVL